MMSRPPDDYDQYPFTAFRFDVQLMVDDAKNAGLTSPLCNAQFSECDGLEMSMEPKTVREGGNNFEQIHLPGPVSYGQLTLKRGMTRNLDLWKWFNAAAGGINDGADKKNRRGLTALGQVTMLNNAGVPTLRFSLYGCLPVKIKGSALNAKDGQVAIEEVQIAYRSMKVKTA
jgi:phage tail-like protein